MKKILIMSFALLTACSNANKEKINELELISISKDLDAIDLKITQILLNLDDENISQQGKKIILCNDFQKLYKEEYIPKSLKYGHAIGSPESQAKYLADLNNIMSGYSKKLSIDCTSNI
ncbi:hypothetical protein [Acinetobacter sp. ANC 4648]|uniref:hypothetical protein n=1 Tax=Acinetobacter sp. ANC 4648 TaxID=1977875 RepID=UPI000A332EE3|nr:hypothetical protein [Acinetobacter sp. ANC 4648]OTG82391.1 hypothetical protein B9T27_09165 [Acinetobacter sp. ANC 4648]